MRLWLLAVGLTLVFTWIPTASAQDQLDPVVVLDKPLMDHDKPIAMDGNGTIVHASWHYRFQTQASPPAGNTTLSWSIACSPGEVRILGSAVTLIEFAPGREEYQGVQDLLLTASRDTPGNLDLNCALTAVAASSPGVSETSGSAAFVPRAVAWAEIRVLVEASSRMAGPQNSIPYPLTVQNLGNAPAIVRFELMEKPGGRWQVLLPDPLIVKNGESATAIVSLVTPYHNGYNRDSGQFVITATPSPQFDQEALGAEHVVELTGVVRGWYIPAPSPLVLLAGLAAAVFLQRRFQS